MKKKFLYILIFMIMFSSINVYALNSNYLNLAVNCSGFFTAEGLELIRKYLNYFRLAAPITLIVMVGIDLLRAVISGEDQEIKRVQKTILHRFIATILLFLVPTMVRFALGLPAVKEKIQIPDDPVCNALKVSTYNDLGVM